MRTFLALVLCATVFQGGCGTGSVECPVGYAVDPVKVDGRIEPVEWSRSEATAPVQVTGGEGAERTLIRLLYDERFLFIAVRCADSQITEKDEDFWKNDSVRVNLRIGVSETNDSFRFGFTATPQGLVSARFHQGPTPRMRELVDFTQPLAPQLYEAACEVDDAGWSMELALSWDAIRPLTAPPSPFGVFIERRNINGDRIEVADWPYGREVAFRFVHP